MKKVEFRHHIEAEGEAAMREALAAIDHALTRIRDAVARDIHSLDLRIEATIHHTAPAAPEAPKPVTVQEMPPISGSTSTWPFPAADAPKSKMIQEDLFPIGSTAVCQGGFTAGGLSPRSQHSPAPVETATNPTAQTAHESRGEGERA